jgi:hypothetical protein
VDVSPDGSIWVAEREHPNVSGSTNRLLKISVNGQILKTVNLDWSPMCVRVDPSDGSLWVTGYGVSQAVTRRMLDSIEGITGKLPLGRALRDFLQDPPGWPRTQKHDAEGKLLHTLHEGGHSLEIERSNGSVWLAARNKLPHYSREGRRLGRIPGVFGIQKYIAVLPERKADP